MTISRVFLLVTLVGLPVMAHSAAPRQGSELEPLIGELRALVATAERQNLADPSLIARLRAFMAKHDFLGNTASLATTFAMVTTR